MGLEPPPMPEEDKSRARAKTSRPKTAPVKRRRLRVWAGAGLNGYFPVGGWTDHVYAGRSAPDDLDQFGPGLGAVLDLGVQVNNLLISLRPEFATLATGEWDDYARSKGDNISSEAYIFALHLALGYRLISYGSAHLDLEFGIGYSEAFG